MIKRIKGLDPIFPAARGLMVLPFKRLLVKRLS
jgi:hypothetical protein